MSTLSYGRQIRHATPLRVCSLLVAGWTAFGLGWWHTGRLDVSRWGTDPDIGGSLQIDQYRSRVFIPFIAAAVLSDLAAILVWLGQSGLPRRTFLMSITGAGCVGSIGIHGLALGISVLLL